MMTYALDPVRYATAHAVSSIMNLFWTLFQTYLYKKMVSEGFLYSKLVKFI